MFSQQTDSACSPLPTHEQATLAATEQREEIKQRTRNDQIEESTVESVQETITILIWLLESWALALALFTFKLMFAQMNWFVTYHYSSVIWNNDFQQVAEHSQSEDWLWLIPTRIMTTLWGLEAAKQTNVLHLIEHNGGYGWNRDNSRILGSRRDWRFQDHLVWDTNEEGIFSSMVSLRARKRKRMGASRNYMITEMCSRSNTWVASIWSFWQHCHLGISIKKIYRINMEIINLRMRHLTLK